MAEADTQESVRPWRFSLVLDAPCQIERAMIVLVNLLLFSTLTDHFCTKVFFFFLSFYCFLDGSVVDIYFSCYHTQSCP